MVFGFIFAAYNGVLNGVLKAIGVIGQNVNWLGDAKTAMWSVLIVALWAGFGNYMIYFISGMSSISEDVYESAKIDGANGIQTFFKITLPMLSPMLKIILMLAITGAFKDYESIMVLTNGGPNNRTQVMFLYIYQLIFGKDVGTNPQIGYATVLSLVAALIIGIVTAFICILQENLMRWYKEVLQMKMRKKNDTAVYSTGTKVIRFLVVLLMSFVAFLTLYPIFYVVLGAFKKNQELLTGGINIFPSEWIVQNFIDA